MEQLQQVEIARMRQLADFLVEKVSPDKFDMGGWEMQRYEPAKTLFFGLIELREECGFAGCAMGWAAHSKMFPELTLMDGLLFYTGNPEDALKPFSFGFNAAAKVLGITLNNSTYLFDVGMYKSAHNPIEVAIRLYRFADKVESRIKRAQAKARPIPTKDWCADINNNTHKLELEAA